MTVRYSSRSSSVSSTFIGSGAYSYTWEHPNRWSRMYEMVKKVFGKDTDLFIAAMEENSKSLEDHLDFAFVKGDGGTIQGNLEITGNLTLAGYTMNPVPIPAGSIMMYGGLSLPTGWLWCDGTAYDSDDYLSLAAAIGGAYDTSAGQSAPASGFFRVPIFLSRIPLGYNLGTDDLGEVGEVTFAAGIDEPGYIVVNYIIKT
jgi:hypothetical protein